MIRLTTLAVAGLAALTAPAQAAPEHVRGTIESSTDTSITVKTREGKSQEVALGSGTAFRHVVKSSL